MERFAKIPHLPRLRTGLVIVCLFVLGMWLGVACLPQETAVPTPPFSSPSAISTSQPIPEKANDDLVFEHLGLEDGLSQSSIYGIAQDNQGFLWFGTEDGLNRYDGYNFLVYRPEPDNENSLSDGFIQTLYTDRDGLIWIGTNSGGLDRFDPQIKQFTHFSHQPDEDNSLSGNDVSTIFQEDAGVFWVGTHGNGLNRLEIIPAQNELPERVQITRYLHDETLVSSLSDNMVTAVYQDQTGSLWIGTESGLDLLVPGTNRFIHYRRELKDSKSLSHDHITAIFQTQDGSLWVGSESGLNRMDEDGRFTRFLNDPADPNSLSQNQVRKLYEDQAGFLWVGTEGGLNRFEPTTQSFRRYQHEPADPNSLSNDSILSLFEDRSGVFWVGFPGGGISLAEPGRGRFGLYRPVSGDPASLSHGVVFGIAEAPDQTIWLGTQGGLNHFDPDSETFTSYLHDSQNDQSLINDIVWAVAVTDEGLVWAGTEGGLDRFDPATGDFTHFQHDPEDDTSLSHNQIWALYLDKAGDLWVGSEAGLSYFSKRTQTFKNFLHDPEDPASLSGHAVVGIFEDSAGNIWVGTFDGGLNRLNKWSGQFVNYRHDPADPASLSHDAVMAFYEDDNGRLYLGTYGGGLNIFDPQTEQFEHVQEEDGLPSDVVYAIVEDGQGALWLSTNQGLSRFDPQTWEFQNFNVTDGLQSREFDLNAYLRSSSGELYFGGINGLNRFDPNDITPNTYLPPVLLTTLTQDGKPIAPAMFASDMTELNLNWPNNAFEFEMAALSFDRSEKNQYAFMLDGFDDSWNMVGTRRFGRYTNLPGGDYTLYLAAANADGFWQISEQTLHITVQPAWWATWWFRGLIPLLVIVLSLSAYGWRLHTVQTRSEELAVQVTERTRELSSLYTITAVASSTLDLSETLSATLDTTLDLIGCDAGGIHFIQGQSASLKMMEGCCLSEQTVHGLASLSTTDSFLQTAVGTGKPDILTELAGPQTASFQDDGFHWLAVLPLTARGVVLGTLFVVKKEIQAFTPPNPELLASIGNQIGVAIENAQLFAAEQSRAEQFQLISEVSHHFTSILDIDQVLAEVSRLIQQTYGYYHVAIGLIEGDEVVYRGGAGVLWQDPEFEMRPNRLKVGQEGMSGWVAGSGLPFIVPDVSRESHYVQMQGSAVKSEMTVPLKIKDRVIGVLDIQSDQPDDFDETDLVVMELLAGQAAIALENARLYKQAQQLAVVEERNRLARDLHDSVTQSIYSLTLLAEAGQRMIQAGDTAVIQQNQERLSAISQQALQEMRLLVYELRPFDLRQAGLAAALENRLEVVERRAGVDVEYTVSGEICLPEAVEEALYRIAHEALNNALKHAQATAVAVTIEASPGAICLQVTDNGRGFETALAERLGGLGLVSMRERVEMLNGRFNLISEPGSGTTIQVEIPLTMAHDTAEQEQKVTT